MLRCEGWWEQSGYGRQPMTDLIMRFQGAEITGQGRDRIAAFSLTGRMRPDGGVELIKQYRQRHRVLYVGSYDGEGTLAGRWDIDGYQGEWAIRLLGRVEPDADREIVDIG